MTFANEMEHLKTVVWRVLDSCGFVVYQAKRPGRTALHRADQPQVDPLQYAAKVPVGIPAFRRNQAAAQWVPT